MKRLKYIFLFIGVIFVISACKNFLVTTPKDGTVTDASFFKTTSDFDAFMFGIYGQLAGGFSDGFGVNNWIQMTGFVSQDMVGVDQLAKQPSQYLSASNSNISGLWKNYFSISSKANQLLDKLKSATIPEADKSRLEGEALFFRGYAYFNLARTFGKVPLILKPYEVAQNMMLSTSEDSIWSQVIVDFTAAAQKIPTRAGWGDSNIGRATKGTVYAYLANSYMYKKDWANADASSKSLLSLGEFNLLPTVRSVFSELNPNNIESIFEVQYRTISDGKINWSGSESGGVLPENTSPRNIGNEWAPGGGWGEMIANRKLADSFEPGDDRRRVLIRVPGEKYKGEKMSDSLTIPLSVAQNKSAFCTKYWLGPSSDPTATYLFKQNVPLMRFAEFKLNYAEILFMEGKNAEGYQQLNDIRKRALLPNLTPGSDQVAFIAALMNERRHELFFEPNLWFHYTRTGTAANFYQTAYGITWDAKWSKFPVPQTERDQNPKLSQNPGY